MQEYDRKVSKAKIKYYPIIQVSRDDLKEIYSLFKKYYSNVGATIVYRGSSYQVEDENDLEYPGEALYYFEIVGYSPFVNLILCRSKVRMFISDNRDNNSLALQEDIDKLLSKRVSRLNIIVDNWLINFLMFSSLAFAILSFIRPHTTIYTSLFLVTTLFLVLEFFLKDYLFLVKHALVTSGPTTSSGVIDGIKYMDISKSWKERIKGIASYGLYISRYVLFILIGSGIVWVGHNAL